MLKKEGLPNCDINPGRKKDFAPGLTYVAISRVRSLRGIMFEEPFDFNRLKASTSDVTIMRATDAAKRLQQEIDLSVEDKDDLPPVRSQVSGPGMASQMVLPILPSDPVLPSDQLRSTVTIPSGFDIPIDMDLSDIPQPEQPVLHYVAGLLPVNPGQYVGIAFMASQDTTQNESFECRASPCNRDRIPAVYRVLPRVDVCIWCNNGVPLDTPRRKMWCGGVDGNGHEVWRIDIDLENNTFCNACEESIGIL
jgi:hypothetical protein